MALSPVVLKLARSAIGFARKKHPGRPIRALSLGFPDVLATREQITDIFGALPDDAFVARANSDRILHWHRATDLLPCVYEPDVLLRHLSVDLDCLDMRAWRGGEIIADLNEPLPAQLKESYELVIDAGTIEHCFNAPQALKNVAELLAIDGVLIQCSPLNAYNHGYWNFNPNVFADFYGGNGFKIHLLQGLTGDLRAGHRLFDVPADARFENAPANSNLVCVCQRTEIRSIRWPTQQKYR